MGNRKAAREHLQRDTAVIPRNFASLLPLELLHKIFKILALDSDGRATVSLCLADPSTEQGFLPFVRNNPHLLCAVEDGIAGVQRMEFIDPSCFAGRHSYVEASKVSTHLLH